MAIEYVDENGKFMSILPIHFSLPGHAIPLSTFIHTANQTANIFKAFNREIFENGLKYEILVLPPELGSFKNRLGVAVVAVGVVAWGFVESDIGKAYVQGLTGQEPSHWAELAGAKSKEILQGETDHKEKDPNTEIARIKCQAASLILSKSAQTFLQTDHITLETMGVSTRKFRDAYESRNGFYQACKEVEEIQAVGFDERPIFPIKRNDFSRLQVNIPQSEEDNETWWVDILELVVTSPNWERNDNQRTWKGRDSKGHERYFRIEDDEFWRLAHQNLLDIQIEDRIKVQWAFLGKVEAPREARVIRVIEFNGQALSPTLSADELSSILDNYQIVLKFKGDFFKDD